MKNLYGNVPKYRIDDKKFLCEKDIITIGLSPFFVEQLIELLSKTCDDNISVVDKAIYALLKFFLCKEIREYHKYRKYVNCGESKTYTDKYMEEK